MYFSMSFNLLARCCVPLYTTRDSISFWFTVLTVILTRESMAATKVGFAKLKRLAEEIRDVARKGGDTADLDR